MMKEQLDEIDADYVVRDIHEHEEEGGNGTANTKIKTEPKLKVIYDSLPISGESGTLIGRYHSTAPQAVGLVRAKTGSTRHTVSLAGFATSGEKEYVFVVIADGVGRTRRLQDAARSAIDRMLGTITKPPVIGITPPVPETNPFTTTP